MLHPFNRAALITLFDQARCTQLREVLFQHQIENQVKAVNQLTQTQPWGGRRTVPLLRTHAQEWQYTIYVPRKDLTLARHLTGLGSGW